MAARLQFQAMSPSGRRRRGAGMTLIEVLVALLVLAVAMMAAIRGTGVSVDNAAALRVRMCAEWVAQDQLELRRARSSWLPLGRQEALAASQGGLAFVVVEEVSTTPSALVRRIDVHVRLAGAAGRDIAVVGGYLIDLAPGAEGGA